jgi:hypothetical protein
MTEPRTQQPSDGALGRRARLERAEPLTPSGREERLDLIGAAEAQVGRYVYRRIDVLMDTAVPDSPEAAELDYLSTIAANVEEYGEEACGGFGLVSKDQAAALAARHPISSEDDNAGGADTARSRNAGQRKRAASALTLSLAALERCRELLINADAPADDLAEYDAATEALRLNIEEWGLTAASLRAPPADTARAGEVDREAIARIVDPRAWELHDLGAFKDYADQTAAIAKSLAKADAILALSAAPTPTQEGKEDGVSVAESGGSPAQEPAKTDGSHAAGWRSIDSAPPEQKLLLGYRNSHGRWRTIVGAYYAQLPWAEGMEPYDDDAEYAPEGWYEESETHDFIQQTDVEPTHWMPLPPPAESPPLGAARVPAADGLVRDDPSSPTQEGADDNAGAGDTGGDL